MYVNGMSVGGSYYIKMFATRALLKAIIKRLCKDDTLLIASNPTTHAALCFFVVTTPTFT